MMTISVVTPCLNSVEFIEEALLSVLREMREGDEFIVVDGGSTDGTLDIIRKYCDRITVVVSEPDSGQADAINKGMRHAAGDILCWINADDYILPGAFDVVRTHFSKRGCDWMSARISYVDSIGNTLRSSVHKPLRYQGFLTTRATVLYGVPQPGSFWTKGMWKVVGELDQRYHYCMDTEFWYRAYLCGYEPYIVQDVVACFRLHSHSKTVDRWHSFERELCLLHSRLALLRMGPICINIRIAWQHYREYVKLSGRRRSARESSLWFYSVLHLLLDPLYYVHKRYELRNMFRRLYSLL